MDKDLHIRSESIKLLEENVDSILFDIGLSKNGKYQRSLKKISDIKGIFHAKMGTTKNRNGMNRTEAEDIKKLWHSQTAEK